MNIVGILLCAGSGTRFGGGKLLHRLNDGTPIGVAALRNLRAALPDVETVVRSGDDALADALQAESVAVHVCEDAHLGMARSLVCAIEATRGAPGWVIALGDMPFVQPHTIRAIAQCVTQSGRIAIPVCKGRRGHPIGFGSRYLEELLRLKGDEGARSVIAHHAPDVQTIEVDDPGILRDIDTRSDLQQ